MKFPTYTNSEISNTLGINSLIGMNIHRHVWHCKSLLCLLDMLIWEHFQHTSTFQHACKRYFLQTIFQILENWVEKKIDFGTDWEYFSENKACWVDRGGFFPKARFIPIWTSAARDKNCPPFRGGKKSVCPVLVHVWGFPQLWSQGSTLIIHRDH